MNKVLVGYTTMTHGLKGDIKFYPSIYETDKFLKINFPIYINDTLHHITSVKNVKNYYLIKLDNLNDINLVEGFRNVNLYIDESDLNLKEGEYLVSSLKGFKVIEEEKTLGIVKDIMYNKVGILLYVKGSKNFYIPLNTYYVKEVKQNEALIITEHAKDLMV